MEKLPSKTSQIVAILLKPKHTCSYKVSDLGAKRSQNLTYIKYVLTVESLKSHPKAKGHSIDCMWRCNSCQRGGFRVSIKSQALKSNLDAKMEAQTIDFTPDNRSSTRHIMTLVSDLEITHLKDTTYLCRNLMVYHCFTINLQEQHFDSMKEENFKILLSCHSNR